MAKYHNIITFHFAITIILFHKAVLFLKCTFFCLFFLPIVCIFNLQRCMQSKYKPYR